MTNKDKYKEAFGVLQPKTISWEEQPMKHNNNIRTFKAKRILAVAAVVVILAIAAVGAYAANVGGIQTTLKTWFQGREVAVEVSARDDGGYDFAVTGENGETVASFGGGGVAMGRNGEERPLTPEEVLEGNVLEVIRNEEGRMMLYFRDRTYDITDFFNADGVCKVKLKDETKKFFKTIYVDVTCEEGSAYSVSVGNPKGGRSAYTALDN